MDKVLIEGLRCLARVGVGAAERRRRQRILVDVELGLDLKRAGRADRVEATIDYAAVCRQVQETAGKRPYRLVEALAESLARRILERFKPRTVRLRIRKFSVPGAASVGVELTRSHRSYPQLGSDPNC